MPTFSAADIVGKTLTARVETPVFNLPSYDPNAQLITTARAGQNLGVVYSWTGGTAGRPLNWQFRTPAGQFYYIPHDIRKFDENSLRDQGVLTTQEKQEQEQEANMSTGDKLIRSVTRVLTIAAVGFVAVQGIKAYRQ